MSFSISIFVCAVSIFVASVEANKPSDFYQEPVVVTGLGHIRGGVLRSRLGELFYAFRGIRYAKPPVGDLRFKVSSKLVLSIEHSQFMQFNSKQFSLE